MKKTMMRTAAAAAATVLVAVGATGPALADHDHGKGKSNHGQSAHAKADKGAKSNRGKGDERGNGHTPVTVCHLLGNGSYNVLTFDDNALDAHLRHGDLYPVPADGCPESSDDIRTPDYPAHVKPGHVRVTVCHLLGNGSYNILTFDQHALRAHEAHGDLYPVPADGCPESDAPEETVPGDTPEDEGTPGDETPAEEPEIDVTEDQVTEDDAVVAGVEEFATTTQPGDAQVLGVQEFAGANRAPAAVGPLAGILPQTGAGPLTLALVAGLGLLGAGVAMIARRRTQGAL